MMRTGQAKARKIHDQMPWSFYRTQTDEDLKAMFAYLKTLAPVNHAVDNSLPPTACARCGLRHGAGERNKAVKSLTPFVCRSQLSRVRSAQMRGERSAVSAMWSATRRATGSFCR